MIEADAREHRARLVVKMAVTGERPEHVPARAIEAEQRKCDVVFERGAGKQRNDLVGAREPAVRALVRTQPLHLFAEQADGAGVALQVAGNQVEQRRFTGAVRPDDEPPLARLNFERDVVGRRQAAERFLEPADLQRRGHRLLQRAHSRLSPGTSPSGMKTTISTNTKPSSMFQRSTYADT